MKELHVIFGTGPLGSAVAAALLQQGYRVRMINRSGRAGVPGAETVAGKAVPIRGKLETMRERLQKESV